MNKELALRTFAYLKTHYQTNNETLISKEDIEAIDFILNENEQLTNLINEYENKGYDIATERADFLLKIQDLQQELQRKDNIINELKKWLNEPQITYNLDATEFGIEKIECVSVKDTLDKIKELENENK